MLYTIIHVLFGASLVVSQYFVLSQAYFISLLFIFMC